MNTNSRKIIFISISVTLLIMATVYYSFNTGRNIAERYAPLVDATMEIKLEVTTAHLWLEEAISGDQNINIETIWDHINQSEWYAQAMLDGGTNEAGTFLALKAPTLRLQIKKIISDINHFRQIAQQRWASKSTSGIGSDIDEQLDLAFLKVTLSVDSVESALQKIIVGDLQAFTFIQRSLIAFIIILGIAICYLLLRYNTGQIQNIVALKWSEEKSYNSKKQLLNVINGAKLGYWDWNYKTGEHAVNSEWLSMLGLSRHDITNHINDWDKFIHPNDKEFMTKTIQTHIQSGKNYVAEFRMKHADGRWIWIQGSGAVVEYDEYTHNPLRLCGTHQNITERKAIEEKMVVTSLLLNESQQVAQLGGWKLELKTGDLFWTDETYHIHDTSPEEFNPTVDAGVGYFLPESKKIISKALDEAVNNGIGYDLELETYTTKGRKIDVRTTCIVTQEEGVPIRLTGIFQDISIQRKNQRKLEQSNLDLSNANAALILAASVFSHAGESIIITDTAGIIVDVNEAFTTITGFNREEAIGQNARILKSGQQSSEFYTEMWQTLQQKNYWTGEVWNRRKDGEVYAEIKTISAVHDEQGSTTHYVAVGNDITTMKEHQEQIERIAHYDILTNLPNRVLLADRLSQAMLQCSRHEQSLAVAFLDLDGFKAVNDAHGHDMGDELLIVLSARMKEALRENDNLARIGGDEFVAVLVDLATVEDCEPILERLLLAVFEPVTIDGVVLNVSASIGVTLYPQDNSAADLLMRHADQAMYKAKQLGKNRYHLFDTAQDDAVKVQRESIEAIRRALDNHQFVLHYQPKVNMRTGMVVGVEALIRWQHPERGLLSPIEFLPVIENHAMMVEVGEWVIESALTQIGQWQAMGLNLPVSTSVNIAAVQLQQPDFTVRLTNLLAAHPNVEPRYLELEVLETTALEDVHLVSTIMNDCMALGVNFALDDFGTGYSSLTYLRRLPASMIKIDQSFVRDMLIDAEDLAIVEGVIALAKSFKRDVIAEGVETIEHGTALLQLGCELAQGYGIAKPMPASDVPTWINDWKPDVSWQT